MRETGTQNTPEPVLLDFVNSLQQFIATQIFSKFPTVLTGL